MAHKQLVFLFCFVLFCFVCLFVCLFFWFLILPGRSFKYYHLFSHEAQGRNVPNSLTVGMGFIADMFRAAHKQWEVAILILINTSAPIKFRIVEMDNWLNLNKPPCWDSSCDPFAFRGQTHEPLGLRYLLSTEYLLLWNPYIGNLGTWYLVGNCTVTDGQHLGTR